MNNVITNKLQHLILESVVSSIHHYYLGGMVENTSPQKAIIMCHEVQEQEETYYC